MQGPLFSEHLISPAVKASVGDKFSVRPLAPTDYDKGFLECLGMLTTVGKMTRAAFLDRFAYLKAHNYEYLL
jgi:glucosamine-phosphate N-acetyltransferase